MRSTNMQERIAEAQALPSFEFHIRQIKDEATGKFNTNVLTTDCVDGRVFDFQQTPAYFLYFDGMPKKMFGRTASFHISVADYYGVSVVTGNTRGQLVTTWDNDNNAKYHALFIGLLNDTAHDASVNMRERSFVRIAYRDLLGRFHTDYYSVDAVNGGSKMDQTDGSNVFIEWDDVFKRVHLSDVTPDYVFSKIGALLPTK